MSRTFSKNNMPKFHCIHCGQHIDAPETMSGMNSNCPTCSGEIQVPGVPMLQTPSPPMKIDNKKESGGLAGGIGTAFFLIICVAGGVVGKNCARSVTPNRSNGSSYSQAPAPPSSNSLSFQDVAGLRIKLPSKPIRDDMKLPPEAAKLMQSLESYKVKHSGAMIGISHMIYHIPEVNLDGSADGSISQVRSLPSTTNFSSNKSVVTVSGLQGRQISLSARQGGHPIAMHGLVFSRGSEAWQIQVIGTSTHGDELKSLSDSIFSSIEVSK
jgi:DNA-directed RNA polymerase subunit RPC12/RpoP